MVDRERVLAKLDALHGYERELAVVLPGSLNDYDDIVFRLAGRLPSDLKLFTTEVTRALSAPRA